MRTLEQLWISPAPWTANGNEVSSKAWDSFHGMTFDATVADCYNAEDARLVAAAPELYEALAAMLHCAEKEAPYTDMSHMDVAMDMARKAVEKASGESEEAEK